MKVKAFFVIVPGFNYPENSHIIVYTIIGFLGCHREYAHVFILREITLDMSDNKPAAAWQFFFNFSLRKFGFSI
jgi:hypothetical protein